MSSKQEATVPCQWCRKPTPMMGTQMCNSCWEVDHKMSNMNTSTLKIVRDTATRLIIRRGK